MQAPINSVTGLDIDHSSSPPSASSMRSNIGEIPRPTFSKPVHSFHTLPGFNGTPKTKGMQLGANKTATKLTLGGLPTELADEVAFAEDNPWPTSSSSSRPRDEPGHSNTRHNSWGTDDLIDVNADEDDWSEFNIRPVVPQFIESAFSFTKGAFESAPTKTPAKPSLSRGPGSSWMTDQCSKSFGSLNGGQITQTTPMQVGKVMTTQTVQSPALPPGTKSPQDDLSWDAVDTGEPPAEKALAVPTGAPASQAIVSRDVKALEIARRKEERKQVCRGPIAGF